MLQTTNNKLVGGHYDIRQYRFNTHSNLGGSRSRLADW